MSPATGWGGADDHVGDLLPDHESATRTLVVERRGDPDRDSRIRAGTLTLDLRARQAQVGKRRLELTAKEFDLLAYFVARPGHVYSRDQLLRAVWQSTSEWQQPATVTEHIRRLRAKIEIEPRRPRILRTIRGAGYRLDIPGEPLSGTNSEGSFAPGTVTHIDGRIVAADDAAAVMFALDVPNALVGLQIDELVSPASRTATLGLLSINLPRAERHAQLIDLDRADGPVLTVEVTSEEFDWNGQRAQHVTFTPIRDRSARLRRLVTGVLSEVTDAVIITDLHFRVRSWNEAAECLYGWRQHEVLGRHILDIVPWDSGDTDSIDIWETLERTNRWKDNGQQVTRDGSVINVLASTTLIRNDSGEPIAIVSVNRQAPTVIDERSAMNADGDDQIRAPAAPTSHAGRVSSRDAMRAPDGRAATIDR